MVLRRSVSGISTLELHEGGSSRPLPATLTGLRPTAADGDDGGGPAGSRGQREPGRPDVVSSAFGKG